MLQFESYRLGGIGCSFLYTYQAITSIFSELYIFYPDLLDFLKLSD